MLFLFLCVYDYVSVSGSGCCAAPVSVYVSVYDVASVSVSGYGYGSGYVAVSVSVSAYGSGVMSGYDVVSVSGLKRRVSTASLAKSFIFSSAGREEGEGDQAEAEAEVPRGQAPHSLRAGQRRRPLERHPAFWYSMNSYLLNLSLFCMFSLKMLLLED